MAHFDQLQLLASRLPLTKSQRCRVVANRTCKQTVKELFRYLDGMEVGPCLKCRNVCVGERVAEVSKTIVCVRERG